MHDFKYKDGDLYCENVRVSDIVEKVGTPAYIYSHKTFVEHIDKIHKAFQKVKPLVCYSMKANSNLAILRAVVNHGAGLDIVSGGELFRAKKAGCPPEKIVFAGVGKSAEEIEAAIRYGILFFNVESLPELELINAISAKLRKKTRVSLRINPDVDANTHHHITTGKAESKFGIDLDTARAVFASHENYASLIFCAIHVHIGSQITSGEPFVKAFTKVLAFIDEVEKKHGLRIEYLNLGGGLAAVYRDETPMTAAQYAKHILPLFRGRRFRLVFEPGRFVSANGGILVGRVHYVKQTSVKNFAIVDAAMNDLIRPSLYDAHHEVCPLKRDSKRKKWVYDVVGPVCESGDVLARDRYLQEVQGGDYLALMTAGAYGFVMSSNYNSRPRPCEVLVKGNKFEVVRKRETCQTLIQGEKIPNWV